MRRINVHMKIIEKRLRGVNKRIKSYKLFGWLFLLYLSLYGAPTFAHF